MPSPSIHDIFKSPSSDRLLERKKHSGNLESTISSVRRKLVSLTMITTIYLALNKTLVPLLSSSSCILYQYFSYLLLEGSRFCKEFFFEGLELEGSKPELMIC